MNYKNLFRIFVVFNFFIYVRAQDANCNIKDPDYLEGWDNGDIWINVKDTDTNFIIDIETEHISKVDEFSGSNYIDVDVKSNIFSIFAKEDFKQFIQTENEAKITGISIIFNCDTGTVSKYLTINVTQTQKFPPEFENKVYNFHLAMPTTPNQIIESTAMNVIDYNIEEKVTFGFISGDPECANNFDFDVTLNNKTFTAKLKTKTYVNLDKNITCDIEAKDKDGITDHAQIIIGVDVENSKVPNPIFTEPITVVEYASGLKVPLNLLSAVYTPIVKIINNEYGTYFEYKINANDQIEIILKEDIPVNEFGDKNYFYLLVEVTYDKADYPGKTAILVDLNKITATTTTSTTTSTTTLSTTTLGSTTPCDCSTVTPETTTISTSTSTETTTLPGESTTCPITCPECPNTTTSPGEGTSTPPTSSTTCPPLEPAPEVHFITNSALVTLDVGETGLVETFKAVSDIKDEEIVYAIKTVDPTGVLNMFEITQQGEINIKEQLDEGSYKITITAFGQKSKSEDIATLFLNIKQTVINCPDNSIKVERLINTKVKENESKRILDANGNRLEFTTDNDDILDWFKFNENDGALEVQKIDREDERIRSLLAPQIQVKIRAVPKNAPPVLRYNFTANSISQYVTDDYTCLNIKNIDTKSDTMVVLVSVEDANDNSPKFLEESTLIVGYPEPRLIDLIAPPYLVKVTATDEDFGDNAKIKYSTNNPNFVADSELGVIFLANEISDNTEFKIIAEDNNGNGGNKAELSVNVKVLKEEHISVITIENIAYSEIEAKVKEIGSLTKQTVKYLTSTALPKVKEDKKMRFKMYADDEKIPAVRIILYALDEQDKVISAKDFKEIADSTDLGLDIKINEYSAISPGNEEDQTGWIAAVSTLSVLLALVIIGGLLGYIFYLRPRMMESVSDGYKKHTYRDSQSSTIETKLESGNTLADRRPTGFPIGFNPKDLDDEDDDEENYENINEENSNSTEMKLETNEKEKSIHSESDEDEDKPKSKSGVKFDTNVTEIEIEEF